MHSWASSSLRKTEAQIRVLAAKSSGCRRSLSTESKVESSRGFDRNESPFLRYGVVVAAAASGLGFYCCSPFNGGGSVVSYADSGARPEKKTFLFTGTDTIFPFQYAQLISNPSSVIATINVLSSRIGFNF